MTRVSFGSIAVGGYEFDITKDNVRFFGKIDYNHLEPYGLKCSIVGKIGRACDSCGDEMDLMLNENLELKINKGVYNGSDELDDIIEIFGDEIVLEEILNSEIELIRSDYHYCTRCENKNN